MREWLKALQERTRLGIHAHTALNVAGLAIALCAALSIVLIIRVEQGYDRFLPDYSRIYRVNTVATPLGKSTNYLAGTVPAVAGWLRLDLASSIEAIGRFVANQHSLRRGDFETMQRVLWADPDMLRVMPFKAIAGDIRTALDRPDGVVLTRTLARRFFGRDTPVGETLTLDREHPMLVTAVIEDLPKSTHLDVEVIGSGLAKFSRLAQLDASGRVIANVASTYFKLRPGVSIDTVERALPAVVERHDAAPLRFPGNPRPQRGWHLRAMPIADIHLDPSSGGGMQPQGGSGSRALLVALASIGGLIVLTATFNYVNLMTARGGLRAVEVGVRKSFGARRRELIFQFMLESITYVAIAAALAVVLFLLLRTRLNAALEAGIPADIWRDPRIVLSCLGGALAIGVLAAIYPAFVLSAFRPAAVMRGGPIANASSGAIRQTLIAAQLAVLVGLLIGTTYVHRQARYALREAFPIDNNLVMTVQLPMASPCNTALRDEIRALPGVSGAACTLGAPFGNSISMAVETPQGGSIQLYQHQVDFDFFGIYGIRPVAGRLFLRERAASDSAPTTQDASREAPLVLNETAVRQLGYGSNGEAIGQTIKWSRLVNVQGRFSRPRPAQIIGVVPDFPLGNVRNRIDPTVFFVDPSLSAVIHVKLKGRESLERTLAQIDALWKRLGPPQPITRRFVDEILEQRYAALTRQTQAFGAFSAVALLIAGLGLFGLSAFATERRIPEVGLRKAMGARRADIVRHFLWEFTKPVLGAAVVAIPVAYILTRRWLDGFAFRVDLDPQTFAGALLVTWLVACSTVLVHVLRAARARPVEALRYE